MMLICFTLGVVHLSIARIWNVCRIFPTVSFSRKSAGSALSGSCIFSRGQYRWRIDAAALHESRTGHFRFAHRSLHA